MEVYNLKCFLLGNSVEKSKNFDSINDKENKVNNKKVFFFLLPLFLPPSFTIYPSNIQTIFIVNELYKILLSTITINTNDTKYLASKSFQWGSWKYCLMIFKTSYD